MREIKCECECENEIQFHGEECIRMAISNALIVPNRLSLLFCPRSPRKASHFSLRCCLTVGFFLHATSSSGFIELALIENFPVGSVANSRIRGFMDLLRLGLRRGPNQIRTSNQSINRSDATFLASIRQEISKETLFFNALSSFVQVSSEQFKPNFLW